MVVTLGQQHNVGEKPTVILYTYINHHAEPPIITKHRHCCSIHEGIVLIMSTIVPSNHTRIEAWVNSKMSGRNPLVYCTIPLIAMQGYHAKIEDTGSLYYNSTFYITSRIGWVSMKGIYKYRCRRDLGKWSNHFCYTYLTKKDQHPPSNLFVYSTTQCSTIEIMI